MSKSEQPPIFKWLIVTFIALAVASAAYFGYLRVQNNSVTGQAPAPSLEQQAATLLETPAWSQEDLDAFSGNWSTLTEEEKQSVRQTAWFTSLESEILQRINQLKQQRSTTDDLREYQNRLNALRVFYSEVAAE